MLSSPEALDAVKQEADGLRAVPVWDETNPQEYASVQAKAHRTGTKVHFGKLMSIASIKFWELAKHLQKVKGRIVYRGDCAKDEEGAAAVYRELGANPTSVQGLNACLAYGSLPGNQSSAADAVKAYVQALLKSKYQTWIELPPELRNQSSAADAVKAYVQALLKSKYQTWIELPPELRPAWWRECFARPVGGLWEKHLKGVLRNMGGEELPEYPGNFWFPESKLLLSTYVDDLTLSGPQEEHQPFWDALCKVVDVEPPEPVYRILGRNHCIINAQPESTENAAIGALKGAMAFDMYDYAQQTVDLYKSLTGLKVLKHAATPFAPESPESSLPQSQEEAAGELAPHACKVLMKALWLGRLARPDLVKPIGDLATKVQKWSRNDDKKLLRLISYIESTKTHRLVGTVSDGPRELHLALYVDADFAGEKEDAKHIARTHKVNLGSIAEVLEEDDVEIEYVDTNLQAADIFTKALPPQQWDNALKLLGMRQNLPEVLVDTRQLKTKAGLGKQASGCQRTSICSKYSGQDTRVECYDELEEMTLVLNTSTELMDIEEAHLRFVRRTDDSQVRMGMPTLKRFARPLDWAGLETALRGCARGVRKAQAHGEEAEKQVFPGLMLRLPGESRKHLLSRSLAVSSPFERKKHDPVHLYLHMMDFTGVRFWGLKIFSRFCRIS
eukprot:s7759_g4.t2